MMGAISGKRVVKPLHRSVLNTNTHIHTHRSCKEMDAVKLSHSEQHWFMKKRRERVARVGRGKMHMSLWVYLMLQDVL